LELQPLHDMIRPKAETLISRAQRHEAHGEISA